MTARAPPDLDDAISIEKQSGYYRIGVHIADVGDRWPKGMPIDQGGDHPGGTSIYMPDMKISMMPQRLAENVCSLKQGEIRPRHQHFLKSAGMRELYDYE
ncbi:MAG: RNB domain-containing ribonuclease [Desulfobacterales bacterium]